MSNRDKLDPKFCDTKVNVLLSSPYFRQNDTSCNIIFIENFIL